MKITIDGRQIEISLEDKNIIDVADRAKIGIPAPCYRDKRRRGCCQVCLVEIDDVRKYACVTRPVDGMNIVVDRDDLNRIRKEKITEYRELPTQAVRSCGCDCSGTSSNCC